MNNKSKKEFFSRNTERLLLLFVTVIIAVMAFYYFNHAKESFEKTNEGYENGSVLNLSVPLSLNAIQKLYGSGGYFADQNYAQFIAVKLKERVDAQNRLPNLGALNKTPLLLEADAFLKSGTESGNLRFINALAYLGMDSALYHQEQSAPQPHPSVVRVGKQLSGININGSVHLRSKEEHTSDAQGVLIKLTRIFPAAYFDTLPESAASIQTAFYARTDKKGNYKFSDVDPEGHYSVVAIKRGFDFGTAKGTTTIHRSQTYNFTGKPYQIRLLDKNEYKQIKADKIFTVRTPAEFQKTFFTSIAFLILTFWLLHIALYLKNYRSDQFILPLIMFILGIGVMVLFSVQDPLRDEVYGSSMANYAGFVLLSFAVLLFLLGPNSVNQFYHSHWFDPLHRWLPDTNKFKSPRGYSWMLYSIVLMLLLALLGSGPEGSGVKVNLFGFQVSELSKYLMVVFFAAFFTANAGYFRNIPNNRWLLTNNLQMLLLFVFLLAIYAFLGDLGPAIVLCVTFLFFYSFAKNEFFEMLVAAIVFGLILFLVAQFANTDEKNHLPSTALVACIATFLYAFLKKKQESVFFVTIVISSFVLLTVLPFDFARRLADRNGMFANIWENKLIGGDQVAHGVWALSSGGFTGQGLGNGFANVMPAYHTDMILQTIAEELGIITLIAIFIAFGLLVYRCILSARRTGKPFLFYLMTGVAITTMLQLALITAGTLGLLPLTGISVPFLSKGIAGLMVTLIAFLFVLIMSNERGTAIEMEYVKKNFDAINTHSILLFFAVVLIFSGSLMYYQIKRNDYIVKPALVLNRKGEWRHSYNPRIGLMLREIKAGNIYDRNGVLLATSDTSVFDTQKNKTLAYNSTGALKQKRYYPFGSNLLFWLGDLNKEIAKEESSGYAAEYRHFTALRGFNANYTTIVRTTDRYEENKFLPQVSKENELELYDYAALVPLLKAGKNSHLLKQQNEKSKDIWLSIDVVMNEKINQIIQKKAPYKNFRTAIVAVNAKTGDVLASAINPTASYKDLKLISNIEAEDYTDVFKQIFGDRIAVPQDLGVTYASRPGSTIKIVDAYAAINQYGPGATQFSFFIHPAEAIRAGEPSGENVDMRQAIVRSSNAYFIKLANEKNLQSSLFNLYDQLGMNLVHRGGFNFKKPADYDREKYFKEWIKYTEAGKGIYFTKNKNWMNTRKRFHSNYSNIAWGQGELMATPFHLAKMSGAIANKDSLQPSRFLYKAWNQPVPKEPATSISKYEGASSIISAFMKEQSAKVAAATALQVYGKTGSPERDKLITQNGRIIRKRITDAWYTFYVHSPKWTAPIAFAIRIEGIGNSEFAKKLAIDMLNELKAASYF